MTPVFTPITHRVLAAVRDYWAEHGYSPSVRDILMATGVNSNSVVTYNLNKLQMAGYLRVTPGISRSIILPPARFCPECGASTILDGYTARCPECDWQRRAA